jgi:predicted ABC-type ATPase
MIERPTVIVLAGPNGAGKSTLAAKLFGGADQIHHYVNADTIARGLSERFPEQMALDAGRIMLEHLKKLASRRANFGFETTLATKSFAPWIRHLTDTGYLFRLYFLWLPTPEMAVERVAKRVQSGGHHVPEDTVRRRYVRGIRNFFELYRPIAETWEVYDNSKPDQPVMIAEGHGTIEKVVYQDSWNAILQIKECSDAGSPEQS